MTTTWNPSDKSANFTLSEANLRAVATGGGNIGVRTVDGATTGKYYFEFKVNAGYNSGYDGVGITKMANSFGNVYSGTGGVLLTRYTFGHTIAVNAVDVGTHINLIVVNDVISCAVDLDNQRIWFRVNGGAWTTTGGTANPATNTGGVDISGGGSINNQLCAPYVASSTITIDVTANFGGSSYTYTPPSGFGNWGGAGGGGGGGATKRGFPVIISRQFPVNSARSFPVS